MIYFTLEELTKSNTAKTKGIDNTPNKQAIDNLNTLVNNVLDPLRKLYGKPIRINSGYRSKALNEVIGGAKNSQHMYGLAADITGGSKKENKILFDLIKNNLPFDQLIDEHNMSWVHVSFKEGELRKEIKIIK